jgi:hypothetical protein
MRFPESQGSNAKHRAIPLIPPEFAYLMSIVVIGTRAVAPPSGSRLSPLCPSEQDRAEREPPGFRYGGA